ncbi:hypothetical protein TWF694_007799 [Orbilia ellipsospora]|uniref:Uncharacterized protein n=1 Tax=Orbilia ellipsospora TaxID=2528407 RepID=A0AAV9XQG2_9PEZI
MKLSTIWGVAALLSSIQTVSAYGKRGAAERAAYWWAYEAETIQFKDHPDPPYTIAKDCVGSGPRGRCNLAELMHHLLELDEKTKAPPITVAEIQNKFKKITDTPIEKLSQDRLMQVINEFEKAKPEEPEPDSPGEDEPKKPKKKPKPWKLTGNIREGSLYAGKDYYQSLEQIGDPIDNLFKSGVKDENKEQIIKLGRQATETVSYLRELEFDEKRLKTNSLWQQKFLALSEGKAVPKLITKTIANPTPKFGKDEGKLWNFADTMEEYRKNPIDGFTADQAERIFKQIHEEWIDEGNKDGGAPDYRKHLKAVNAAKVAARRANCDG